jgi:hypothetical protein
MSLDALRTRALAILDRFSWIGPLAVRLSLGAVFVGTGWGKLHNLEQVTNYFTSWDPLPAVQAPMVSGIELVGGVDPPRPLHPLRCAAADGDDDGGHPHRQAARIEGIRSLLAFESSPTWRASCGCSSPAPGRPPGRADLRPQVRATRPLLRPEGAVPAEQR